MVNNFMDKGNLLLIERLVINKFKKSFHCRIVIQFCNLTNQQSEGRVTKFPLVILVTAQFACQHT